MSKKEKREKDQEKNIPQQETACEEETEKQPEAETKAGDQEAAAEEAQSSSLEELQKELGRQKDLLLRTAAEYENFRKRTEKEKRMSIIHREQIVLSDHHLRFYRKKPLSIMKK